MSASPVVQQLCRLIAFRTVSGEGPSSGSYAACATYLRDQLQGLGFDLVTIHDFIPDKPVVLATKFGTDRSLPSVLLNAHYDVVPVDPSKWSVDPFAGVVKEGRVYGRGAQDMKCVLAQYLEALRRLGASWRGARNLHVSFVPDEEIGGSDGMLPLLESEVFKTRIAPVGLALDEGLANPEDAFSCFYGERAPLWVILTSRGPTGHGSRFIEATAVERLARVLNKAFEFRRQEQEIFEGKRASKGCTHAEHKKLGDVTTLNVTMLKAGVPQSSTETLVMEGEEKMALNVIPTTAKAGMDIRVPPNVPIAEIKAMLTSWCREEQDCVSWKFAPWTQDIDVHAVTSVDPVENPFWKVFKRVIEEDVGVKLEPEVFPAGTDSRMLREKGIRALGFSPMRSTPVLLHEDDEWIGVDRLEEGVEVYVKLIPALCGVEAFESEGTNKRVKRG